VFPGCEASGPLEIKKEREKEIERERERAGLRERHSLAVAFSMRSRVERVAFSNAWARPCGNFAKTRKLRHRHRRRGRGINAVSRSRERVPFFETFDTPVRLSGKTRISDSSALHPDREMFTCSARN